MPRRCIRLAPLLPLLLAARGEALHAQSLGVSAGLGAPVGALADGRGVGVRVQGSLYSPERRLRLTWPAPSVPATTAAGPPATIAP